MSHPSSFLQEARGTREARVAHRTTYGSAAWSCAWGNAARSPPRASGCRPRKAARSPDVRACGRGWRYSTRQWTPWFQLSGSMHLGALRGASCASSCVLVTESTSEWTPQPSALYFKVRRNSLEAGAARTKRSNLCAVKNWWKVSSTTQSPFWSGSKALSGPVRATTTSVLLSGFPAMDSAASTCAAMSQFSAWPSPSAGTAGPVLCCSVPGKDAMRAVPRNLPKVVVGPVPDLPHNSTLPLTQRRVMAPRLLLPWWRVLARQGKKSDFHFCSRPWFQQLLRTTTLCSQCSDAPQTVQPPHVSSGQDWAVSIASHMPQDMGISWPPPYRRRTDSCVWLPSRLKTTTRYLSLDIVVFCDCSNAWFPPRRAPLVKIVHTCICKYSAVATSEKMKKSGNLGNLGKLDIWEIWTIWKSPETARTANLKILKILENLFFWTVWKIWKSGKLNSPTRNLLESTTNLKIWKSWKV